MHKLGKLVLGLFCPVNPLETLAKLVSHRSLKTSAFRKSLIINATVTTQYYASSRGGEKRWRWWIPEQQTEKTNIAWAPICRREHLHLPRSGIRRQSKKAALPGLRKHPVPQKHSRHAASATQSASPRGTLCRSILGRYAYIRRGIPATLLIVRPARR
jgi:hypothetical protein